MSDSDVSDASSRDITLIHDVESAVMFEGKEITIFALVYFNDCNDIKSFTLKMKPRQHADKVYVIVYISDLFEVNQIGGLVIIDGAGREYISSKTRTAVSDCINPWLVIFSLSLRYIATLINMKRQSVDLKVSHVALKLGVFNRDGLLKMAHQHRWVNFIPDRFVTGFNIIRVS